MVDPSITIGTGLAILGSKDLLLKLIGPTAEYLGQEVKGLVEKCNINLDNIFIRATKKLGKQIDEIGSVSPRVLKRVFDEGRFCEDEISQEYFAGLLASSRSKKGDDDRALPFLSMVRDLSSYALRTHYILYTLTNYLLSGGEFSIQDGKIKRKCNIFVPFNPFSKSMGIDVEGIDKALAITNHSLEHLSHQCLIEPNHHSFGTKEFLQESYPDVSDNGFVFQPSAYGATLYLWVHGAPDVPPNVILCKNAKFKVESGIEMPNGSLLLGRPS